jgi:raffinose/stachyose/melibiose transport system permease protein
LTEVETLPALRQHATASRRLAVRAKRSLGPLALLLVTFIVLLPVLMMLAFSLRTEASFASHPLGLPLHPAWGNYTSVFRGMHYLRSVGNTLLITIPAAALTVVVGSLCAWALARHVRRWTALCYALFVAGLAAPGAIFVVLTPLYLLLRDTGLLNTYQGLILVYTALNLPLAMFFFSSFLRSIPVEIEEAAVCDGASTFRVFVHVIFPLLRPVSATLAIFVTLSVWNDLVMPLILLTGAQKTTVVMSAYSYIGAFGQFSPIQLFPAMALASLPLLVVFVALQRHIIAGMVGGAVKG